MTSLITLPFKLPIKIAKIPPHIAMAIVVFAIRALKKPFGFVFVTVPHYIKLVGFNFPRRAIKDTFRVIVAPLKAPFKLMG
nr:unnamed protein product [Callosobruchus chinensis]